MFWVRLRAPSSLQTFTRLLSAYKAKRLIGEHHVASISTVQFTYCQHHLNHALLNCTNRGSQTLGTRAYSPFMYSLRRTVVVDIALSLHVTTIDVTFQFLLDTTAIYRSSAKGHNHWTTDPRSLENCLAGLELLP